MCELKDLCDRPQQRSTSDPARSGMDQQIKFDGRRSCRRQVYLQHPGGHVCVLSFDGISMFGCFGVPQNACRLLLVFLIFHALTVLTLCRAGARHQLRSAATLARGATTRSSWCLTFRPAPRSEWTPAVRSRCFAVPALDRDVCRLFAC